MNLSAKFINRNFQISIFLFSFFLCSINFTEHNQFRIENFIEIKINKNIVYIYKTETTQKQWENIMMYNPLHFKDCGLDCPVENVSYIEVIHFLNKITDMEKLNRCYQLIETNDYNNFKYKVLTINNCNGYRLLKTSEFEFLTKIKDQNIIETAVYNDSFCKESGPNLCRTSIVGSKKPDSHGLYDIYGNVSEWADDEYDNFAMEDVRIMRKKYVFGCNYSCKEKSLFKNIKYKYELDYKYKGYGFRVARNNNL